MTISKEITLEEIRRWYSTVTSYSGEERTSVKYIGFLLGMLDRTTATLIEMEKEIDGIEAEVGALKAVYAEMRTER